MPAYFIGKYMEEKHQFTVMCLASFIKFLNALTFFTATLQGMEIYPTCMRQTGCAFGTILANSAGVLSPYLVYLSITVDIRSPYYFLSILFFIAAVICLFLPETLHKKLPDTLEEAKQFGVNDKFFSLPKAPQGNVDSMGERQAAELSVFEKLNQDQYAS